jgi:hypothetical protein
MNLFPVTAARCTAIRHATSGETRRLHTRALMVVDVVIRRNPTSIPVRRNTEIVTCANVNSTIPPVGSRVFRSIHFSHSRKMSFVRSRVQGVDGFASCRTVYVSVAGGTTTTTARPSRPDRTIVTRVPRSNTKFHRRNRVAAAIASA